MNYFIIKLALAVSLHTASGDWNHIHPHIYVENQSYKWGIYYNSDRNISLYTAKEYNIIGDLSVNIGIVTGYNYPVIPMIQADYRVSDNINLLLMPSYTDNSGIGAVFGVQINL